MKAAPPDLPITVIGHPFAPIGRGEDLRCGYRALRAAGIAPHVVNVYEGAPTDAEQARELRSAVRRSTAGGIDLFYLNGDEIDAALTHLGPRWRRPRHTVVLPVWELPQYPADWAAQLERFDEIWVPSVFIRDAVAPLVARPVTCIPWSTGIRLDRFLGRRYFGIPESAYAFLFGFDLRSYHQRKNPEAVIEAFARVLGGLPQADLALVVKVSGIADRPDVADALLGQLRAAVSGLGLGRCVIVEGDLTDAETKNLVRACDCFVSLHRSEGFGRYLAEAMLAGKPVVATGYSGNMEFMTADNSCPVGYQLVPVPKDAYPRWEGQMWADPDVDEAARCMRRLAEAPSLGRALGARASRDIRTSFSYRAIGLRYLERLRAAMVP